MWKVCGPWCVLLLLPIAPLAAQRLNLGGPGYAGDAVCQTCHPDLWGAFSRNPHFKTIVFDKPVERTFGCESCHGPSEQHPANPFDKANIYRIQGGAANKVLDTCLACHAKDFTKSNVRRSAHSTNEVACTECHAIHSAKSPKYLLARPQKELCYACHLETKAQFEMPFRHRVNEGAMACTDCHNPHGSFKIGRASCRERV